MFERKFDRWLSDYRIHSPSGMTFDACVTIKDLNGSPNADGVKTIEKYAKDFPNYWEDVYSKFIEFNSEYSSEEIEKSIKPKIFMYAPALVGSTTYDLMVLFELKSDVIQHQNCTFCYSNNELVLSEQHM